MPPTPTPTTSGEASLLFYVLLALTILSTAMGAYALYRSTRKTDAETKGTEAQALQTMYSLVAQSGGTYKDLIANVRQTVETQIRQDYEDEIDTLKAAVSDLSDKIAQYESERETMRQQAEKEISQQYEVKYQAEIDELKARVKALETERAEDSMGMALLIAQLGDLKVTPRWLPRIKPQAQGGGTAPGR